MVVLLEGSPFTTDELYRVTIEFVVTSLTKALHPRLLSLTGRPALARILVLQNYFYVRMMEATVFLWPLNAVDIFGYHSTDLCLDTILSLSSNDNSFDLMACFSLTCTVNCETLYRQVCAFPNQFQTIEFTTV